MALKTGDIVEGKVTGLTNFGAFVTLESGEKGMVHISEVSRDYVKEITDVLSEGMDVKVKVLNIDEASRKISLSIRQAQPESEKKFDRKPQGGGARDGRRKTAPRVWQGSAVRDEPQSFEDMMAKFKSSSEEIQADVKRAGEQKHGGGYSRRGQKK